jgi:hypothetical protein
VRFRINVVGVVVLSVIVTAAYACSSSSSSPSSTSEDGGVPRQCLAAPAAVDLTQPEISFKTQVAPIITKTCSVEACHADKNLSLGIYLPQDPVEILKALRAPSTSNLKLDVVKPGSPTDSFIMHKLDGTQCNLDKDCVDNSCGAEMPPTAPLSLDDRNTIRRWIAQGAKDN